VKGPNSRQVNAALNLSWGFAMQCILRALSLAVKLSEREVNHLPPTSVKKRIHSLCEIRTHTRSVYEWPCIVQLPGVNRDFSCIITWNTYISAWEWNSLIYDIISNSLKRGLWRKKYFCMCITCCYVQYDLSCTKASNHPLYTSVALVFVTSTTTILRKPLPWKSSKI
jgi:hypothetical protein